jgi:uncharacterized membrane protein (DUF2068 family)
LYRLPVCPSWYDPAPTRRTHRTRPEEATVSGHPPRQIPRTSRAETLALDLIVLFKAIKSAALFVIGLGLMALIGRDVGAIAQGVAEALNIDVHREYAARAIARLAELNPRQVGLAAAVAFGYSALLAVEAVGLARRRSWAAWLAVSVGSMFLTIELYEIVRHPGLRLAAGMLVNAAIVVYLVIEARRAARDVARSQ